ncbi:MAG: HPF/RaiA family ribosome-associated protein [Blastochloris sp.]|nr:HPF/RaiA family ribosome-associated protein [Blastochloris sp.]
MKIQINTDNNIDGSDALTQQTQAVVEDAMGHFAQQITRVEVHLSDENSHKGGRDKRCVMEARLEGMQPVAVTDQAQHIEQAVQGAADKLKKLLDRELGRLSNQ